MVRSQSSPLLGLSTLEVVPRLSPQLTRPDHLAPYANQLDDAVGSDLRVCFSAPPQHGKTVVTLHALIRWMALPHIGRPLRFAYCSFSQERADEVAREARELAFAAGLEPTGRLRRWRVNTGAEVKFVGIGGPLTGYPVSGALIVDDPIKDREEASSKRYRDRAYDWLTDVALSRLHPGAAVIVMATRWHVDDLTGRLTTRSRDPWPLVNLKAVWDGHGTDPLGRELGEALWESGRPREWLRQFEASPLTWASLYQGEPRPAGDAVFGGAAFVEALPTDPHRVGYGVDLAYTAKTSADWSVLVELWRIERRGDKPLFVVADVVRRQCPAPEFVDQLRRKLNQASGPMLWYAAGTEKGAADFVKASGVPLVAKPPRGDKLTRALPVSEAWNDGRVLVPRGAPWSRDFLAVVEGFTGVHDAHDDDVDALAAAYDVLAKKKRETGLVGVGGGRAVARMADDDD